MQFERFYSLNDTFRLDESTTTTPLPPPVPRSTQPLRRNSTTLVKHNSLLSITICHPHRQIGHGDINKTISQLLVDPLTLVSLPFELFDWQLTLDVILLTLVLN